MRSLLAVLLSFTLFASTLIAQTGSQNSQRPNRPTYSNRTTAAPVALYECDGGQCEDPNSGGAVWLFQGDHGQGMWLYEAVTKLTLVKFDGRNIHIHRADPSGTYSSAYTKDHGEFLADYYGTVSGNRIDGYICWGGGMMHPA